jgi:hypothetical protein
MLRRTREWILVLDFGCFNLQLRVRIIMCCKPYMVLLLKAPGDLYSFYLINTPSLASGIVIWMSKCDVSCMKEAEYETQWKKKC